MKPRVFCVILLVSSACAYLVGSGDPAIIESEFIYESGPYPEIHATTIVETPTGLVSAWFGGSHERNPDVGIWVSRQVDGKWTESTEVANGIQNPNPNGTIVRYPTWNPVLFQVKNGPLMLFYKVGPSPQEWWGMLTTSNDGGKTWRKPSRLPNEILGPIKNKPVLLSDGRILCGSSEESSGQGNQNKWTVHFECTSDLGETWERTPPLNDGTKIEAIQPSILFLGGDNLLAVGRTRQDKIFEIRSEDNGKTWGKMVLGNLPNNNSGLDAVTLKDGTQVIVYNHVGGDAGQWGGKRTPLNISVSADGANWEAALVLENKPGEYSYPAIIQSSDGLLHVTYTWNRKKVKHVVIDPAKLSRRPIVDGQWP